MAGVNSGAFRVQHVAPTPRGWHVRTKLEGAHQVRIAFPPGARKTGSGQVVEILHPRKNPACEKGSCGIARKNPAELVIFGNPGDPPAVNALVRKYNQLRKSGYSKPGAIDQVLRNALAGPATIARFQAIVAQSNPKKNSRRNQDEGEVKELEQAVELFETFHGKEPGEVIEEQRSAAMRADYAALGDLLAVGLEVPQGWSGKHLVSHWEEAPHISFEGDAVKLASAPNGRQLYAIGGNQDLDRALGDFGVDATKDLIDLGEAAFVVYLARKAHSNFEPTEWVHEFGEKTGEQPRLLYDRIKKEIAFAGGEYFIDTTDELSPGIEN